MLYLSFAGGSYISENVDQYVKDRIDRIDVNGRKEEVIPLSSWTDSMDQQKVERYRNTKFDDCSLFGVVISSPYLSEEKKRKRITGSWAVGVRPTPKDDDMAKLELGSDNKLWGMQTCFHYFLRKTGNKNKKPFVF